MTRTTQQAALEGMHDAETAHRTTVSVAACEEVSTDPIVRAAFDRLGDKWTMPVLGELVEGPVRFGHLRQALGVSHRVLTVVLRRLEREGLVSRKAFAQVPPRVDYALTDLGWSVLDPARRLAAWAHDHADQIRAARERYDGARQTR